VTEIRGFRAVEFYAGNLYVLDPRDNQVWRYYPTASGYDSERKGILEPTTLKDSVALSIDGDVYLLETSGRIRKFSAGREVPFAQDGLDRPLLNATALHASRANKWIYVADAGNRRIVAFDKEGHYQRQFTVEAYGAPRALFVDEGNRVIYFADQTHVFAGTLPD
jgi:sugar lactone lactonase YvrE